MKWTGLNELREQFLSFYESKGHTRLASAPLVPQGDASLLLINSGMAPLKKFFLGLETPPNKRVTTCQKCIRTPDIERVGKTSRHGTFFEMLGNFSFGDYFKREATAWAWEFITKVIDLPLDRIWVTIYQDDDEAFDIWTKEVGVDPNRIVRLGKDDNFWEIGTGPCGPCSEIYFDRGIENGCGSPDCAPGCECDRFVEFWNLVFTQFNSDGNGNYEKLEHPNIDTGMGLERLACIVQGVSNLFEVDTVQNIMKHVSDIADVHYGESEKTDVSLRVITDHIRSTVFMIGDGVVPQNEGRGYVLRRLLRRAARHGRLIGIHEPFLFKVCETVIKENATAYPELVSNGEYIKKVIRVEEERFAKTIDQGMELLNHIIDKIDAQVEHPTLSGEIAFKLYDTFGFPIDLTREIIAEKSIEIDEEEFTHLMQEQRERARAARASMADVSWEEDVLSSVPKNEFVGYTQLETDTKVLAILKDGELADSINDGETGVIVLEKTPFYAESGGQVGDSGVIISGKSVFKVFDCKKSKTGQFMHIGEMSSGFVGVDDLVRAHINTERRKEIARNHSAAHLLQAALREVLGDHVHQAGSYVDEERCRFDFSHFSAMTAEEIQKVEDLVNKMIFAGLHVGVEELPISEAKKRGAMALFGEKYGDVVRVCTMGQNESVELCGGTHVENTANIGLFKILSETSVAAGVRRIEATTAKGVLKLIGEHNELMHKVCQNLKLTNPNELVAKSEAIVAEMKAKDKEIETLNAKMAQMQVKGLFENAKEIGTVKLITASVSETKTDTLRAMADRVRENAPYYIAVLSSVNEGKGTIVAACGSEAVKAGIHCGKLVKELCSMVQGSGGGKPDSAMGGAQDIFNIDKAFANLPEMIEKMLGSR